MPTDDDIEILNSLITSTIDSADGFERAAEQAEDHSFFALFRDFGAERRQVVAALQQVVLSLGGTPNDDASLGAILHRRWLDLKKAIAGDGGDRAIVEEVERGEDHLKAKYGEALADEKLSETGREAVRTAFDSVRAGHDTTSSLKHRMEALSS